MFIDLHCHILPDIDDGAESTKEALDIARLSAASGSTIITATPHYNYTEKTKGEEITYSDINASFNELNSKIIEENIKIKLFPGAELLARSNIEELCANNSIITINGSRYVLTEFYFDENITNVFRYTDILISAGYTPIIAHPERYSFFNTDNDSVIRLLENGCRFQLNKDSILGRNGAVSTNFSLWMLENNYAQIIASDCHNPLTRNSDLGEVYFSLLDTFTESKLNELLHDNPKRVLLNLDI